MTTLGVIGGSGVYTLKALRDADRLLVETPFGVPSAPVRAGTIGDTTILFVPRHGEGHRFSPTNLPYRANIHALKQLGATHVLSLSAVGSLREDLPPRSIVIPDQVIDRTVARERTFFDESVVAHVGMADPFCPVFRRTLLAAAKSAGQPVRDGGTYVCIEGPQFSTRAESQLYRSWGATIIGMTAMPEARLAREAELCYAALALVTDFDVWHDSEADVSVEMVMSNLEANGQAAANILDALATVGIPDRACGCADALQTAIVTVADQVDAESRRRLRLLAGRRLGTP